MIFGTGVACSTAAAGDLPQAKQDIALTATPELRKAVLASGCFWCSETVFEQVPGVTDVVSGYAGDTKGKATYDLVSGHGTKHAECVQITYDASKVTYGKLLQIFFTTHDPTTLNRQGPDEGSQYRSAIFVANDEEQRVAEAYIAQLGEAKAFDKPIVTTVERLAEFYPAEQYHQDYARLNPLQPYIQRYARPKAQKAKEKFGATTQNTTK